MKGIEITIRLDEFVESRVSTREDGQPLREYLTERWKEADKFTIDFEGLTIASVSFIDEAFGKLAQLHGKRELTRKIKVVNISEQDRSLLNEVVMSRLRQFQSKARAHRSVVAGSN